MRERNGVLYVVATPIGNLADITQRGLQTLKDVDLICAEDTRTTRKLLSHYGIRTPLTSFFEHTNESKRRELIGRVKRGERLALVSESGTPTISDPGFALVQGAAEAGVEVVSIPGPTALAAAICVSGFPADAFVFLGFLPRSASKQRKLVEALAPHPRLVVLYESPLRVKKTLTNLAPLLADSQVCIVREATKRFEETIRGTAAELAQSLPSAGLKGEVTIVIQRELRS
jgi:16S rRNA (cytidine1402-2'-O)-methyltransferase